MLRTRQQVVDQYGQAALTGLQGLGVGWNVPDEGVLVRRGADRDASTPASSVWPCIILPCRWTPVSACMPCISTVVRPIWASRRRTRQPCDAALTQGALAPLVVVAGNSQYVMTYPEDLQTYGLSFSSLLRNGRSTRAGELSYRPQCAAAAEQRRPACRSTDPAGCQPVAVATGPRAIPVRLPAQGHHPAADLPEPDG